jgi:hypothetical protein
MNWLRNKLKGYRTILVNTLLTVMPILEMTEPMKLLKTFLTMSFVGFSVAACQTQGAVSDGAGYSRLSPNSQTRSFITQNDTRFRDQVAAHNLQCSKDKACR